MNAITATCVSDTPSHDSPNGQRGFQIGYIKGWQRGFRKALLDSIETNLQIKYGSVGQEILPDITETSDIGTLMTILEAIRVADSPEELLYLSQSLVN